MSSRISTEPLLGTSTPGRTPSCWRTNKTRIFMGMALGMAVFVLLAGIFVPRIIRQKVDEGVDEQVILTGPSGPAYDSFVQSGEQKGVRVYYSLSWYNITNGDDVLRGAKPVVNEMGPYVYWERRRKWNVTFSEDGERVSYILQKWYEYSPELSGSALAESDQVITINPVTQVLQAQLEAEFSALTGLHMVARSRLTGLRDLVRSVKDEFWKVATKSETEEVVNQLQLPELWKPALKLVLCQGNNMGMTPFTRASVRDLYFGYHNDSVFLAMQDMLKHLVDQAERLNITIPSVPEVPEAFPGLTTNVTSLDDMYRRIGPNEIYTGTSNRSAVQQYIMFQNMTEVFVCPDPTKGPTPPNGMMPACYVFDRDWNLTEAAAHGYTPQWYTSMANQVWGTDSSAFGRPVEDVIVTFQEDYRRAVIMQYNGTVDYKGLTLRRYIFRDEDWRNDSSLAPDFYQTNLPTGLTNISHTAGFPLYLSKTHFLGADPTVLDAVIGLSPDYEKDLTHIDVEPRSGLVFSTHKRVQLNVHMQDTDFKQLKDLQAVTLLKLLGGPTSGPVAECFKREAHWDFYESGKGQPGIFIPMVSYHEGFDMPENLTSEFITEVYCNLHAAQVVEDVCLWGGVALVGLLVCIWTVLEVRRYRSIRSSTGPASEPLLGASADAETKVESV